VSSDLLKEIILDIPVIKGRYMRLYSPTDLKMTEVTLSLTTRIDCSTAYCFIGHHTLLACGGNTHPDVFEINTQTGEAKQVSDMNSSRRWLGIYKYKEHVFAFGGYGATALNSAEKCVLATKAKPWTNIHHFMIKAKEFCSVVEHSSGLYVSGYANPGGTSIEHFNPSTEMFKLLKEDRVVLVPILFCVEDELIFLKGCTIETADVSNGPDSVAFTEKAKYAQGSHIHRNCPVQLFRGELLCPLNNVSGIIGIFKLTLAGYQFTQAVPITY